MLPGLQNVCEGNPMAIDGFSQKGLVIRKVACWQHKWPVNHTTDVPMIWDDVTLMWRQCIGVDLYNARGDYWIKCDYHRVMLWMSLLATWWWQIYHSPVWLFCQLDLQWLNNTLFVLTETWPVLRGQYYILSTSREFQGALIKRLTKYAHCQT